MCITHTLLVIVCVCAFVCATVFDVLKGYPEIRHTKCRECVFACAQCHMHSVCECVYVCLEIIGVFVLCVYAFRNDVSLVCVCVCINGRAALFVKSSILEGIVHIRVAALRIEMEYARVQFTHSWRANQCCKSFMLMQFELVDQIWANGMIRIWMELMIGWNMIGRSREYFRCCERILYVREVDTYQMRICME